jgi:hypothetical protein
MSDLIQKLAEQARDYANDEYKNFSNLSGWFVLYNQKLAELIVKKCVSIVAARKDQAIEDGCNVDEAMSAAETDLLEHFGVKE